LRPWPVGQKKIGIGTGCEKKVVEESMVATGTLTRGMKRRKEKDEAAEA
jgi:hypothetical protein